MARYAEVINNNGRVTIDDSVARLAKTRTLSITAERYTCPAEDYRFIVGYIENQYILDGYCIQQFDLNSNEIMVSVRAKRQHANVVVLGGFVSSKKYQVTLFGNVADNNVYKEDYLIDIYGYVPSSGGTNSGLEIFNASGTKIFDSDFYTLDVSGTYSVFSNCSSGGVLMRFDESPETYHIGSYETVNHSVVINSSVNKIARHKDARHDYELYDVLYGVVFGTGMYLEKRVSIYTGFMNHGGGATPHGYSHAGSGIILNTKNIT